LKVALTAVRGIRIIIAWAEDVVAGLEIIATGLRIVDKQAVKAVSITMELRGLQLQGERGAVKGKQWLVIVLQGVLRKFVFGASQL
jgi:hypothetical protein